MTTTAKQRLESLDVLRACCALMVMANHLYNESGVPQYSVGVGLVSFASEAVVGFFVLSGCLISLQGYSSIGRYVEARLVRILPIYYVLLIFCVLAMLACGEAFTGWNVAANAFFIQTLNWTPLNPVQFYVQSWSLSYELWYYAGFIAIMVMPRLLWPFFLASIAAGAAILVLPQSPGPTNAVMHAVAFFSMWLAGVLVTHLWQRGYAVSLATGAYMLALAICLSKVPFSNPAKFDFGRLFLFSIGFAGLVSALLASTFGAFGGKPLRTFDVGPMVRGVVALLALAVLWTFSSSHKDMKLALSFLVAIFTLSPAAMVRLLSPVVRPALPFLVYVGGLSYALYLVHYPLLQILNSVKAFPPIVNIAIVIVLAFGLAHLLDYGFQPWIRSRLRRPQRAGGLKTAPQRNETA